MHAAILAMTWELLRRGRRLACWAIGMILGCAVVAFSASDKTRLLDNFEPGLYLLMISSLILVFAIFHQAEFNARKNWHGFPYRMFTLPVGTSVLVIVPMVTGVAVVELVYLAWAELVFKPLHNPISFWPAAVLAAALPCYQALVWSLAGFRITRLIALAFAGMFFMDLGAFPAFPTMLPWPVDKVLPALGIFLTIMAFAAFFAGWIALERQRRGGGRGHGWCQARMGFILDALPRRKTDFASEAAAQFWLEWRWIGWLLPSCTSAAIVLIFLPVGWFSRTDAGATLWILGWALALPAILATAVGVGFSTPDFWSGGVAIHPFQAVRPISSEDIVVAKLKVALLSAAVAWIPVLGFLAFWLSRWANLSGLRELWSDEIILHGAVCWSVIVFLFLTFALTLTWRGMVCNLWAGLSGSLQQCLAASAWQILAVILVIRGFFYLMQQFKWERLEQYVQWVQGALVLAVGFKVWLAVFSWRKISASRTGQYAAIWAAGTGAFVLLTLLLCPNVFWLKPLAIMTALLPFPLARLGFSPAALNRNRHQP